MRISAQINNTSSIDLPLCGGVQQLTLSIPQFFFDDARRYPLDAYIWQVPTPLTVVNGTPATDFGPGTWVTTSSSITVSVPAGQLSAVVRVRLWSRECNQNPAYNNPPGQLISFDQNVTIRRVPPTITSVTASRTALTCGDVQPIMLTANASQAGASSFSWSLPPDWTFATGSSTNTATVSVIPSGGNGGSPSVQASYTCVSPAFVTSSTSVTIGYTNQVATPVFTEFGDMCLGQTRRFAVAPVPGATSYTWTLPGYFPNPTVTTTVPYLDVTASSTQGSAYASISVSAGSGSCPAGVASQPFNAGGMSVHILTPHGLPTEVCPNTEVSYHAELEGLPNVPGPRYPVYTWTVDGNVVASGPQESSISVLSPPAGQWMDVRVDVSDNCSRATFDAVGLQSVSRLSNGQYCVEFARTAPAAYPNPADATLTLQQPAGTQLTIYNAQGRAMYRGKAAQQPAQVDTRAWPEGLYYLHTRTGSTTQRHQLQIQH